MALEFSDQPDFPNDGKSLPHFSSILHPLVMAGYAQVRSGTYVTLGTQIKKRQQYADQYRRPRETTSSVETLPSKHEGRKYCQDIIKYLRKHRSDYINSKEGLDICSEHDIGDGRIRFSLPLREKKVIQIYIENSGSQPVDVSCIVLRKIRVLRLDHSNISTSKPLTLNPGERHPINIEALAEYYGYYSITAAFQFRLVQKKSEQFFILRFISGIAKSRLAEELKPISQYKCYQATIQKSKTATIDEGVQPDSNVNHGLKYSVQLKSYNYPPILKRLIRAGFDECSQPSADLEEELKRVKNVLDSVLTFENYTERFQLLIHLEEIQMEVDIKKYDMRDAPLEKDENRRLLVLKVPGVAENRPSVLRGDHLYISRPEDREKSEIIKYKGYVHAVELDRVKLGFSANLLSTFVDNMKFDVEFTFNRLPLRLQHRAAEMVKMNKLNDVLFPSFSYGKCILSPDKKLKLFDRKLEDNPEQYAAVRNIVAGLSRPAPYLIFGPPGTGKTVTIVEAMKQVLHCIPDSHILACAPSNSASDLLCQRLSEHVDKRLIYRIIASSRDYKMIPEDVKPYCNWDSQQESFVYPSIEDLQKYRIIITTLVTAGRLVSADFPKYHFSHIFIDEAGHAVEPECVIPIAGLLEVMDPATNPDGGQLVLAGDPKQLGPILRSPKAIKYGLDMSLLERLMTQNTLYQKDVETNVYNKQFVTKLLRNYRSHRSILEIPNQQFYDGELLEYANEIMRCCYCNWDSLPKKDFPIIFYGVLGEDAREGNSPSFFNTEEIDVVIQYLKLLLLAQGKKGISKLSPKEIGVITPYRKQVEKLRRAINDLDKDLKSLKGIKDLKVGSVEEFQGQERRVIIISTVRTSGDYLKMDEEFSLGFVKNPKRFNVAMTRAKSLLIVVGNPVILSKDPIWMKFINYCSEKGGWTGYVSTGDDGEDDLVAQLTSLQLNPVPEETANVEPEWRNDL
ncbi:helicase MOV-10 isoform X2 [Protopterus annectens]|uniref:helicase MOV-10 isoform X2 n=1 Tax=Protopterus annectens TaxID=7888 RepID=UPI001CFC262E|nr:helicase MOV-10 isoform X2 [Protopterus annectens]